MIFVPYLLYRLNPPELRDMEPARALARENLHNLGRMKRDEIVLVFILVAVMIGWVTSPLHGIANAFLALAGFLCPLRFRGFCLVEFLFLQKKRVAVVWVVAPLIVVLHLYMCLGVAIRV